MTTDYFDSSKLINSSCLSLLLLEIVPTSIRVSHKLSELNSIIPNEKETIKDNELSKQEEETEKQPEEEKESNDKPGHPKHTHHHHHRDVTIETKITDQLSTIESDLPGTVTILDSNLIHSDDVTIRIENHGINLGLRLSEILMFKSSSLSSSTSKTTTTISTIPITNSKIVDILDIMKFVCRDVWKCLFNKQMDNLRTNHRGTFVLVDNSYKLISNLNSSKGLSDTLQKSKAYLWFPCGVIRGILMSFGIDANVTAEIVQFPAVTFNVQTSINN